MSERHTIAVQGTPLDVDVGFESRRRKITGKEPRSFRTGARIPRARTNQAEIYFESSKHEASEDATTDGRYPKEVPSAVNFIYYTGIGNGKEQNWRNG